MKELDKTEIDCLKILINKFPQIKKLAILLNNESIRWAIAAGSAYFIYTGRGDLDDVDIWVSESDKEKTAKILGIDWINKSSDRHAAENIYSGKFDIFTNCRKFRDGKMVLWSRWTETVTENIRKATVDGVDYFISPPEDVGLIKIANPRNEEELHQAEELLAMADKDYLEARKKECCFSTNL